MKTNSKESKIIKEPDGSFRVLVKSLPKEGMANKELIKIFSDYFKVFKSQIVIKSGKTSSLKILEIV